VTDPAVAERETELAILSAVAHGNGPNGLAVVQAALVALARLDREHAAVYFQIIWNALREPMQRALEALVMERQAGGEATFPPFAQRIFERGLHEGERKGRLEGKLEGKRDTLLRLLARAGIALTEDEVAENPGHLAIPCAHAMHRTSSSSRCISKVWLAPRAHS
jgi:hypothetical protein